ncbi:MAG: hypothetical protein JWP44_2793 [Mucilaginibacter sp.]|nr:hypothetical protein [Mucilaginibacter sp.]
MNLGTAIKTIRKQKGLRQNSFATMCDITQAYLSQIENNLKEPNISILKKISENLNIPLPILFFMSLEVDDLEPEKKEAFKVVEPTFKILLEQIISNN